MRMDTIQNANFLVWTKQKHGNFQYMCVCLTEFDRQLGYKKKKHIIEINPPLKVKDFEISYPTRQFLLLSLYNMYLYEMLLKNGGL